MYGRSRINVKVEPRSTFTFTRGLSHTASISFTRVNFTCVRTENYATVEIHRKFPNERTLKMTVSNLYTLAYKRLSLR